MEPRGERGDVDTLGQTGDRGVVVVTGANRRFFRGLKNLVGSLHWWSPGRKIVVYNLGLNAKQLEEVKTWNNTVVRWPTGIPSRFPPHVHKLKKYAWKPIAINESLHEWGGVLWIDAGSNVRAPLDPIDEILKNTGVYTVQGQDGDMTRWTHTGTFKWFGKTAKEYAGKPSYSGGLQGWMLGTAPTRTVVPQWTRCALQPECISPAGSSLSNHRYDQSVLSILAYDAGLDEHTEHLAYARHQLASNPFDKSDKIVWASRQGSTDYVSAVKTRRVVHETKERPTERVL